MSNTSRNHHYIPQFYLKGFLDPSCSKEQFCVIDKIERRHFVTRPRNVGSQRDFNRVDIPGMPSDVVEKSLSEIEGEVAQVLKYVEDNATLPQGTDMDTLLYFVALLYGHNPPFRDNLSNSETAVIKQMLRLSLLNPERYESWAQQEREADKEVREYEEVKRFVEEENYDIRYGHGHHLRYELQSVDKILSLLRHRQWSLFIAEEGASDFVCSDRPVALITIGDPPQNPDHPYNIGGPGLAQSNTELTMPLNRRMALFGSFKIPSVVDTVGEKVIADVNGRTILSAAKQIYCSNLDFKFLDDEDIKNGRDLVN